jgi:hypothetical protein
VAAQTGLTLQDIQRDMQQSVSPLFAYDSIILIPHQRRQQSADVLTLLPSELSFFPDQMEGGSLDRITFDRGGSRKPNIDSELPASKG